MSTLISSTEPIDEQGNTAQTSPLLVDGYQTTRRSRTVVHDVLGSFNQDVSIFPPTLRTGTFRLIYATREEAAEAERMHLSSWILTFSTTDTTEPPMSYVLSGNISRELDPQTQQVWIVSVDFQEVSP